MTGSFASLRTAAADAAPVWLPATLQAMIIACLTRLLDRLEHLLQLWKSGQLPGLVPAQPARPHGATPRCHAASPSRIPRRMHQRAAPRAHRPTERATMPARPAPASAHTPAPPRPAPPPPAPPPPAPPRARNHSPIRYRGRRPPRPPTRFVLRDVAPLHA
ncbi:MAG: hypothetical protein IT555_19320 [Acetobacteraceae bacterium]|nr:hypothetical protein [Acetobacteraceae bacterium]